MGDLSKAAGAASYTEVEINGRTWKVSPLTLNDLADFENWVRSRRLKLALNALPVDGTDERQKERNNIMNDLLGSYNVPNMETEMASLAGTKMLLYYMLRRNHKDLTEEEAGTIVTTKNLADINTLVDTMSGIADDEEEKDEKKNQPTEE